MDGVLFIRDYLPLAKDCPNFETIYFPQLIELLNDEESFIRIEAIDVATDMIDKMTEEQIENEFIKMIFDTIDCNVEEILLRLAGSLGRIVYALKRFDLYLKHKDKFLEFYMSTVHHKEIEMRKKAAYNLPCFNALYKDHCEDIDF